VKDAVNNALLDTPIPATLRYTRCRDFLVNPLDGENAMMPTKRSLFGRPIPDVIASLVLMIAMGAVTDSLRAQQGTPESRDGWQRPEDVMNALGAKPGSVIADIGAVGAPGPGMGYFTFHLAARVGITGKVYAVDIRNERLEAMRERVAREGLSQVIVQLGAVDDPLLPEGSIDAILVSNAYHDFTDFDEMLQGMNRALKSGGTLVILDKEAQRGLPRVAFHLAHEIPKELVREDATRNGFVFVREEPGFTPNDRQDVRRWYFLIFRKP
jgi:predicted methyltransferase